MIGVKFNQYKKIATKGKFQSYIGKAHIERRIVMSGVENGIGVYSGKQVRIITPDNKIFEGYVSEYIYDDDNESGNESIIIDIKDGRLIEFETMDIQEITVIDGEEATHMSEAKEVNNRIIVFPDFQKLKDDVERLRTELSMLMLERDELRFVICKNIETEYMLKLGSLEYKAYEAQCAALRLKRRIELIQARKNRQEAINLTVIDKTLDEEFLEYEKKLNEQVDKMNDALEHSKGDYLSEEDNKELKKLYRKIVRVLHPDINPEVTMAQVKMLDNAINAYKNGDLKSLRIIDEMVGDHKLPEKHQDALTQLKEEKKRLNRMVTSIQESINKIKSEYPYCVKDILEDEKKVEQKKAELEELLKQYMELVETYNAKIKEMLR